MEYIMDFLEFLVTGFDCGGADILRIIKFISILLNFVLFMVPVGLIIMLMIDFFKTVIAGKEDDMKKNLSLAIKRIIYCIVLFLVPTIVSFVISVVGELGVDYAKCIKIANTEDLSKYEIDYENMAPKVDELTQQN